MHVSDYVYSDGHDTATRLGIAVSVCSACSGACDLAAIALEASEGLAEFAPVALLGSGALVIYGIGGVGKFFQVCQGPR